MAPLKRGRRVADEEVVVTDGANSSLHQRNKKKARLSGPNLASKVSKHQGNAQDLSGSLSDSEFVAASGTVDATLPPSTQHEIERDAGFAHLDNSQLDDERATRKLLKRSELLGENHAAENGVLESVTMINFMCHEKLHVTLGPLINFITGPNGSGKSTILTAITLCLGGKASTTNRGGSLKSFIKEGRDHANLIIHIKNQGTDAYQPDVYGRTITVERGFSRAGTSGFKLKNASGRLVSNKKADIEEIIEYFQMQIDNPMSVLTQDNARQFLAVSAPHTKYRYFVKGVQLEQLDNDYRLVSETADAMSAKLEINRATVSKLETNMKLAQDKRELVEKHAGMREAVKVLSRKAAWAQVENEERILRERDKLIVETQLKIEHAQQNSNIKSETYEQANIAAEHAGIAIRELVDELMPLREEEGEARAAYDIATQEIHNIHLEHRQIKNHLDAAKVKVIGIQKDIDAEIERIENANGGAHTRRLADLELARQRMKEARARLDENSLELPQLEAQTYSAEKDLEKLRIPIELKSKEISACEKQLQLLSRDIDHNMAGFDHRMPSLLNMIHEDTGFREMPIGPIGLHIRLLKPIWSSVLERSLGNTLNGFIVTSKADHLRLSRMIRQLNIDFCPVIIGNHQPINTTGHEPDQKYETVLGVLDIDNALVRAQLIINQGIEQTILIEGRQDAMKIMYDGVRPQNVRQCFCLHDKKRGYGIRLGFMPGSADPSSSPITPTGGKPRMKTDAKSQIAYQRDTLKHLQREFRELQNRQRELQQALKRQTEILSSHRNAKQEIQVQLQREEDSVERLQDEVERDNVEDGRLEAFKDDLREAKAEYELHGGSFGEVVIAKEKQNATSLSFKRALDVIKDRIADQESKIRRAENKAKRIQQARQLALQEKNISIDALSEANMIKDAVQQKRDRQEQIVKEFIGEASKICPRLPVDEGETVESIDAKLVKLTAAIRSYNQKVGGTDDEIHRACEEAVNAYRTASKQLEKLEELLGLLKQTYKDRLERWRKFQRYISARARTSFTYLLSERGFRGKLVLDHKQHLLEVKVEPDETSKSAAGRAIKTLSGGEKSFSSICLLLSVWEAMGSPLRCLDEYDVFMDHVNRDVSTNLIIAAARRSVGRQFILISPLSIGDGVNHDKDVKFIRLGDPRQALLADL